MRTRSTFITLALIIAGCSGSLGGGDSEPSSGGSSSSNGGSAGKSGASGNPGSGGNASGSATPGNGGNNPGSGGEDPGSGGDDPGSGGDDPGSGGDDPGSGGDDPGSGGGDTGGSGGVVTPGEHYELTTMPGGSGDEPGGEIPICCVPSSAEKEYINEVFELLNAHRAANGVPPLTYDDQLEAAVLGHCHHMETHTFFAHEAPEAAIRTPWTRAELCGSRANGENIASGQRDPQAVMEAWISSSGHNQNMLNDNFTRVGIAYHEGCWGQLFGS